MVDLASDPTLISPMVEVVEHRRYSGDSRVEFHPDDILYVAGMMVWDYVSEKQGFGGKINGKKLLRKELKGRKAHNANLLDYLLANPHFIPRKWMGRKIFFWGTIFRHEDGTPHVRYLYWSGESWTHGSQSIDSDWSEDSPAAVFAR
jgi:hypothetical protein